MTNKVLPSSFGVKVDLVDFGTLKALKPCEPVVFRDPKSFDVIEAWATERKDKIKSVVAKVSSCSYSFFYTDRKQYPVNMLSYNEDGSSNNSGIVTRSSREFVERCVSKNLKVDKI